MKMKSVLGFILTFLLYFNILSQQTLRHQDKWHFGTGCGIDFSSGAPVNFTSGIDGYEATTGYCDGNGNTLFYAGGSIAASSGNAVVVWDATNTGMPNGDIDLDGSSSAGLISAPVPGNCDQYYIFHLASTGPGWGLHYSLVDMTLPGNGTVPAPLGDIAVGQKDILIYGGDELAEKIEIVQQGNTENYWVITRSINNDNFYAFLVTNAGISNVPVTSTVTPAVYATPPVPGPLAGWIAVSPDRNWIAECNLVGDPSSVVLYSFDNQTGVLTFEETLYTGLSLMQLPYGIEFSENSEVLYFVRVNSVPLETVISNYDLTAGVGSIAATQQDFLTDPSQNYGGLVRGKDGRLYQGQSTAQNSLTIINDPNNYAIPNITFSSYSLAPNQGPIGMPNLFMYFHPEYYVDTIGGNDRTICNNDQVEIGALGYDSVWVNYTWEPAAMLAGSPNEATPLTVNLTADQQYIVHLVTACGDTVKSDTTMVLINGLNAGSDTTVTICDDMQAFDLLEFFGGTPDPGGVLTPALSSGTTVFDPSIDVSGNYVYTHLDACGSTSAITVNFQSCQVCTGNLVPNASFENIIYCPNANGQMDAVMDWDKPVTGSPATGTSDYYNTCGLSVSAPNTGNGYASFFTYVNFLPNSREYVQTQLTSPLVAGQCYEVSMYLALEPGAGYTHDSIGMYFSNTAPQSPGGTMISVVPQFATTAPIPNSNWVQVSGTITAVGGEEFLTIGVFSQDANLTINTTGTGSIGTKHMVDDVCVIAIQEDTIYTSLVQDDTLCDLAQDTLIGPPGYDKYTWVDNLGNILVIDDTLIYTPSANTYYILNALDASVCPNVLNIDTVNVVISTLDAGITTNSPICENQTLSLNGTPTGLGAGNYQWAGPNGPFGGGGLSNVSITPFPNPIPGGYFYLTVTDGLCSDTDSVLVVSNPTYNITIDTNICEGTVYTFPDGSISTILADETNNSSLVTTEGCDSLIITNVTMVVCCDLDVSTIIAHESCDGANDGQVEVTVNGSGVYDTYIDGVLALPGLVGGGAVYNITNLPDGTFSIQLIDQLDPTCDTVFNITINPGTLLTITTESATDITDCLNPDGTITVTVAGATNYELYTAAGGLVTNNGTGTFTGLNAGDYYVVADDGTCTVQSTTLTISNALAPAAPVAGTDATYCDGDPLADLTATASSGGTLNWYDSPPPAAVLGSGPTFSPTNTLGATIYYVTETVNGCESPASAVTITINAIPAAPVAGTDMTYCSGDPLSDMTATAGSGGTLNWFDDAMQNNLIGTGTNQTPNNVVGPTTYYVTESIGACTSNVSTVTITINDVPMITSEIATDLTNCTTPNGTVTITSNGTSYELFDASNTSLGSNTTGAFTGLGAGDYYVIVSNGNCTTTGSTIIVNDATQSSSSTQSAQVCAGSTYTFADGTVQTISSNISYTSTLTNAVGCDSLVTENITVVQTTTTIIDTTICEGSDYTSVGDAANFVNVLADFQHTSTLTGASGCDSIIIENVSIIPAPTIDLGLGFVGCIGDSVTITATTNGGVPVWSTGDTAMSITVTLVSDVTLYAEVTGQCGTATDSVLVTTVPAPIVDAGADVTIPLGGIIDLEASSTSSPITYEWSPSTGLSCTFCPDPSAGPVSNTSYIVMGTDENGCIGYDTINVVIDGEISFYIPNIFSPNNDGENDLFQVYGPQWKEYRMEIYDRWGGLVFESEDPNVNWDGTHFKNQHECPQAVFVYKFWGVSVVGMTFERAGNVMLTR